MPTASSATLLQPWSSERKPAELERAPDSLGAVGLLRILVSIV